MNAPECQHCNSKHFWIYGVSKVCLQCDGDFEPRVKQKLDPTVREQVIRSQVELGSWTSLDNDDLKFLLQELDQAREVSKVFRQTVEWYAALIKAEQMEKDRDISQDKKPTHHNY